MKKKYWIAILGGIAVVLAVVLIVAAVVSNQEKKKDDPASEDTPITNVKDPAGTSVDKDGTNLSEGTENEDNRNGSEKTGDRKIKEDSTEFLPEQGKDKKNDSQAEKPSPPQTGNLDSENTDSKPIELRFLPYGG